MKSLMSMLLSAVIGIAAGILIVLGQEVLTGYWDSIANSRAVWLLPAFFIGAFGSTKVKSSVFSIITLQIPYPSGFLTFLVAKYIQML